jgi:hypothetical protein
MKNQLKTRFMSCQRFLRQKRDPGPMSMLPCPHPVPVPVLPGPLSRTQIVLPAVHGADDGAPPERLSARPMRLAAPSAAPVPPDRVPTAHVRRVRAGQRQARRRPAPAVLPPAAPSDAVPGQADPGYCHRLDIQDGVGAGYRRSRAAGQPVLLPGPHRSRVTGRNRQGADGHGPGSAPGPNHTETAHLRRAT